MSLQNLIIIGSGGFIGAVLRVLVVEFVNNKYTSTIPFAILFLNLLGSLLAGLVVAYFVHYNDEYFRNFFVLGFLGALTTYSTFAIESIMLLHNIKLFLMYVLMSAIGSILFAFLGYKSMLLILK